MTIRNPHSSTTRRAAATAAAVLTLGILSGCGDTQGDLDATLPDDVEALSEDLGTLGDRVTALEDRLAEMEGGTPFGEEFVVEGAAVLTDPTAFLGEEVTVAAQVSELYDTTDAGVAFRIAGDVGEQLAVVSTDVPDELLHNDIVRVTGTVMMVEEGEFEQNFGVAADELFNNAVNFFVDADGKPAVAAESVEVVQAPGN